MKILIHGLNYHPELIGIGKYTGEMAQWLANKGHEVNVVTAPPYYPEWKTGKGYSSRRYKMERVNGVGVYRCPLYVPKKPTGLKRILHLLSFSLSSGAVLCLLTTWRPQIVITIAPSFFSAFGTLFSASLCNARTWLHIQDFELDAAFRLGILQRSELQKMAFYAEKWILRRFNRVSTISPAMLKKLKEKGIYRQGSYLFPNWVDTNAIYPLSGANPLRDQFNIGKGGLVALYSGNMGTKQGLEIVVEAARMLVSKKVTFVLCGDGPTKSKLKSLSSGLPNIHFFPLQPLEKLNQLLNMADIHLLPQRSEAADIVMPSKLTGMSASGKPVVAIADAGTDIEKTAKIFGIVVRCGDSTGFADAIAYLADHPEERETLGRRARAYAIARWDKESILQEFETSLREFLC